MTRSVLVIPLAAALLAAGCSGWSSSGHSSPPETSSAPTGMTRVPAEGNSWIGSIIPRIHRAGLRITIPAPWGTSSYDGPAPLITSPASGSRVPRGTVVTLQMQGFLGSPYQTAGHYVVPGVIGVTLRAATAAIEASGLPWRVEATALPPTSTNDLYSSYCVDSQKPTAGTDVTFPTTGDDSIVELAAQPC